MITLSSPPPSVLSSSSLTIDFLLNAPRRSRFSCLRASDWNKIKNQRRRRRSGKCRAEISYDAPFTMAIGACVLNSLIFPVKYGSDDDAGGSGIDSTDARFAVMGIISFIPYFNWMSWVFAWLDSGRQRYLVYSIVYLVPYLRTNLSLSTEESWLPIASIVVCILHVQLEASIKNGDLNATQLFGDALKLLFPMTENKETQGHEGIRKKGRQKERGKMPSAHDESRSKLREREVPKKPLDDSEHSSEGRDADEIE